MDSLCNVNYINFKSRLSYWVFWNKKVRKTKPTNKRNKMTWNTDDLIFRKKINLPSGTLLSLSSYVDIECGSAEYNSAESLTNKYKLFKTKSKTNN